MDDKHPEIIIIKRHSSHEDEHHGGAWKIAFADFMTAMMAFFLVLWIINATDKDTKTIIARYFNPLKLEDMAKTTKGIRPPDPTDPGGTKSGEGVPSKAEEPAKGPKENDKKAVAGGTNGEKGEGPFDLANPKPHLSEAALFDDPYASLEQIAGKMAPASSEGVAAAAESKEAAGPGVVDLDSFIDPFKPLARGPVADSVPITRPESLQPAAPAAPNALPHPEPEAKELPPAQSAAIAPEAERPAVATPPETAKPQLAEAAALQNELAKELRVEIHAQPAPGIEVEATSEGTLISLTDEFNFGMFASGSAEPQAKVVRIMEKIAQILKSRPGAIVVRGHTDSRPYKSATYDNWRLSSARAQMAYYMLIRGGLDEKRIERIEGYADHRLKTPAKPEAAENRRIEILLRKEKP